MKRALLAAALLLACGSADRDLGPRVPADDHLCPAERPFAYQPADMERAQAAGCTPAWTEGARMTPTSPEQKPRRMLVACCRAR